MVAGRPFMGLIEAGTGLANLIFGLDHFHQDQGMSNCSNNPGVLGILSD
jgi:hypothetical protein